MKTLITIIIALHLSMNLYADESIVLNDKLTIHGDNMTGSGGLYTISGDVHINNLLFFDDEVEVEVHESQSSRITTSARLYVKDDDGSIHYLKSYVKSKTFVASDSMLLIDGTRFTLYDEVGGFDVFCATLTFDSDGNYLDAGFVPDFPGIVKDVLAYYLSGVGGAGTAGNVDLGIQYFKDGTTDVRCIVEDLIYAHPMVLIENFDLIFNPAENVFGGGFKMRIPAPKITKSRDESNVGKLFTDLFGENYSYTENQNHVNLAEIAANGTKGNFITGIIVDMLFVEGAIESFTLGIATNVPIGATGTFLTSVQGSASGLSSDNLELSATVNVGTVLDPLVTLENLGVTIKKGYFSGAGEIRIFKKNIASGKIYYSKAKKAMKVKGRLNLSGVLKGKVKAGIKDSKFSGSSRLSVNTPDIDIWAWSWLGDKNLGYAKASIHRNTRFRAKLSYSNVDLAIQAKYKSSYPYFKFYIGSNYDDLHRIVKTGRNGKQAIGFVVDDNVRHLILIAGNDANLFDFTATNPDGAVFDHLNTHYEQIATTKQTKMMIANPVQGEWTFNTAQTGEISFNALQIDQPPTIMLHLPTEKASKIPRLSCSFTDYQDTLNVEFHYDTDNKDFDGTLINEFEVINNASIDFHWQNQDIDNGEYYIYAVVDDGQNAPLMQYAPGSILVNNWDIAPPGDLIVAQTDDSVLVRWTLSENPDIAYTHVYMRNASRGDISEFTSTTDSLYITDLINGHQYEIWAAWQNENDQKSFAGDTVAYNHLNPLAGNNTPYFTLPPEMVFTFQSGEYKTYTLSAGDADADPLIYDIVDMPPGMALTGDQFSWTPADTAQGVYNLKFTVSDGMAQDSAYYEIVVYNVEQGQISIQYSSLNLYKDDNLFLIVRDLHNPLPEIDCSWRNPFTGQDIGIELRQIDEFTYLGQIDLPEFPTDIGGIPVDFENFPIVATYNPVSASAKETYTTSGIYNVNPQGKDETSPAAINDISISKPGSNLLLLKWTASGDDGATGKAYSYDLRYGYTDITTETEYNNSFQFQPEPYPQPAGSVDSLLVDLGTLAEAASHNRIYFSLKAIDESNNTGALGASASSDYLFEAKDVQYHLNDDYTVLLQWHGPASMKRSQKTAQSEKGDVAFLGYNIYRKMNNQDFILLQSLLSANTYFDSLRNEPDGNYVWAIEPVYDTGNGEMAFSDTLLVKRFYDISIVGRLQGSEDFSDISVSLTGLDTMYAQNISALSDSTGLIEFSGVYASEYKIMLDKNGYYPVLDTLAVNQNATEFSYFLTIMTGINDPLLLPETTEIYQNYPNPFNAVTSIRYRLAGRTKVSIKVYNVNGQLLQELIHAVQNQGTYSVHFDAKSLSSGLYFIHFKTEGYQRTIKSLLIK
jgi:hypothetical protein